MNNIQELQNTDNVSQDQTEERTDIAIAIVAHDGKKVDMVVWATFNRGTLARYNLVATGTTGKLLEEKVGLRVERLASGPYGGDAQIASRVVQEEVDCVFFFVDPLDKHPHDPDIQMLMRVCNVHNIPLATNIATADLIISSNALLRKHGIQPVCDQEAA